MLDGKLKPILNPVDTRDFTTCFFREGEFCKLYNHKLCKNVNHRKLEECIYRDNRKLDFGNPYYDYSFVKLLSIFLGEPLDVPEMDLNGKVVLKPGDKLSKRKALGKSPLDKAVK